MATDLNLFLARRLGYGLRPDEDLPTSPRDWAVSQLQSVPPLDWIDKSGNSIHDTLPPEAKTYVNFEEACAAFEEARDLEEKHAKQQGKISDQEYENLNYEEYVYPYPFAARWRDCLATTLTAVNGDTGVFERFWWFWVNHFTVSTTNINCVFFYGPHTREIRNAMTGSFEQMLTAGMANPAMLVFLDNHVSTGPNSRQGRSNDGNLNENLARELLELHTMSPAGGYSQEDVVEAALILTGWQFYSGRHTHGKKLKNAKLGTFFEDTRHEPGKRTVLGKTYKQVKDGRNQLPELLHDLAHHPATARFIAYKLARAFLADTPPDEAVARIEKVFNDTEGDLIAVHTAVVDEVVAYGPKTSKFTTPVQWLLQAYRVTGASVPLGTPRGGKESIHWIWQEIGQTYDECPQPIGYPDREADWLSREMLDRRIRQAFRIAQSTPNANHESLVAYTERLAGAGSPLALAVRRAETAAIGIALLLSSSQFMRI